MVKTSDSTNFRRTSKSKSKLEQRTTIHHNLCFHDQLEKIRDQSARCSQVHQLKDIQSLLNVSFNRMINVSLLGGSKRRRQKRNTTATDGSVSREKSKKKMAESQAIFFEKNDISPQTKSRKRITSDNYPIKE